MRRCHHLSATGSFSNLNEFEIDMERTEMGREHIAAGFLQMRVQAQLLSEELCNSQKRRGFFA